MFGGLNLLSDLRTDLTDVQYQSGQLDIFSTLLEFYFPYITLGISMGFEHFGFVKITMLHPSL
jgi:hypothetical protein